MSLEKAIRVRIEKIKSIEDPLEAYVFFFKHFKINPDRRILGALQAIWQTYKSVRKDLKKLERGEKEFLKIMKPELDRLLKERERIWKEKIEEIYESLSNK